MTWNINSIRNKFQEVKEHILRHDIIVLTETKLDKTVTSRSLKCENFSLIRSDRNSKGGGVLCYVKSSLDPKELVEISDKFRAKNLETTIVRIRLKQKQNLVVIGLYRPPQSRLVYFDSLQELLTECLKVGKIIILGDLNCNIMLPEANPARQLLTELHNVDVDCYPSVGPTRITNHSSTYTRIS